MTTRTVPSDAPGSAPRVQPQTGTELVASMPAVISGLVLARAQSLAHNGEFKAAENVLQSLLDRAQWHLRAMDLLARIRAQQGRYQDAAELWDSVIQSDPSNAEARSARNTALGMTRWRQIARPGLAVATALALIIGTGWLLRNRFGSETAPSVANSIPPVVVSPAPQIDFVNLVGWRQERTEDGIRLLPRSSLFGVGTSLTKDGRSALDAMANQIHAMDNVEIEIRGTSDTVPLRSGSLYRDNEELRTVRAARVFDYLSRTGAPPSNELVIRKERISPADASGRSPLPPNGLRGVILLVRKSRVD